VNAPVSELLIRAAFDAPAPALAAWQQFRQRHPLDSLLGERARLLSRIYRRLQATAGALEPDQPRLAGIHRFAWTRHQIFVTTARDCFATLHAAGIAGLLVKGLAIAGRGCAHAADRPAGNLDLLVAAPDVHAACRGLAAAGWRPLFPPEQALAAGGRAVPLLNPHGLRLILHWQPLLESRPNDGAAALLAARTEPAAADGPLADERQPGPTDLLTLSLARSVGHWHCNRTLWAQDALLLLEHRANAIDWPRVADHAAAWNVVPAVREGLRLLQRTVPTLVPAGALAPLAALRTDDAAEAAYRRRNGLAPFMRHFHLAWARARAVPGAGGFLARVRTHMLAPSWSVGMANAWREVTDRVRYA